MRYHDSPWLSLRVSVPDYHYWHSRLGTLGEGRETRLTTELFHDTLEPGVATLTHWGPPTVLVVGLGRT